MMRTAQGLTTPIPTKLHETADLPPKPCIHQILTKPRAQIGAGVQIPNATHTTQLYLRMHGNNITPLPAELDDAGDIKPKCRFQQNFHQEPRVQKLVPDSNTTKITPTRDDEETAQH